MIYRIQLAMYFSIILLLGISIPLQGAEKNGIPTMTTSNGIPKLTDWIQKFNVSGSYKKVPGSIRTVVVLKEWKGETPLFQEISQEKLLEINNFSFFKIIDSRSIDFAAQINAPFKIKRKGRKDILQGYGELMGIDIVVDISDGKYARLVYLEDFKVVKKMPYTEGDNIVDFLSVNFTEMLGYDGIVLDTFENYILVRCTQNLITGDGINALTFLKSHVHKFLKKGHKKGSGLYTLENHEGGYAIFSSSFSDSKGDVQAGTKILIEKN